ncbi:MAG: PLP-dependent aminotransferase family protein [Verrucomicrobia bacterium]|nr:PLP-dependent aminotransferase family protein [Verrucomicrobiota bacterium]
MPSHPNIPTQLLPHADPPRHRPADTSPPAPAYLALANSLENQVQANVFRPGDRLPSVRSLCGDHRLSMETVLHTLRVLEDRGIVEARPRSGFYIKWRRQLPEPLPPPLRLESSPVAVSKLRHQAFSIGRSKGIVPLSNATPAPEILPTAKLGRMISVLARAAAAEVIAYAEPAGHQKLRTQLARRSSDWGCLMKPEDFIITNGAAEAIALALRTVCAPNSAVLVESPTYYGILETIETLGLRVVELPTDPQSGVSPDDLERAVRSIPKIGACLLVTNHSNPLGCTMSVEKKKRLVAILARDQVPLIEDDIYGDLCQPGHRRPVTAKAFDREGLVLLCGSISKTLAPGLRVGWIAPGRYRGRILELKTNLTLACPTIPQMAVAEFLEHGSYDAHLRKIRALFADQLQRFSNAIARYFPSTIRVSRPQGGFVLWVELDPQLDTTELAARALDQHQIAIAPGCIFSANGKSFRNCLRISCGYPWSARIEQAMKTLGQLIRRS